MQKCVLTVLIAAQKWFVVSSGCTVLKLTFRLILIVIVPQFSHACMVFIPTYPEAIFHWSIWTQWSHKLVNSTSVVLRLKWAKKNLRQSQWNLLIQVLERLRNSGIWISSLNISVDWRGFGLCIIPRCFHGHHWCCPAISIIEDWGKWYLICQCSQN